MKRDVNTPYQKLQKEISNCKILKSIFVCTCFGLTNIKIALDIHYLYKSDKNGSFDVVSSCSTFDKKNRKIF